VTTYLDFTGTDPNYTVADHRIVVFPLANDASFVAKLLRPAYLNTVRVYVADTFPMVELTPGVDFVFRESDYDHNAVGKAKVSNPAFNYQLVGSVTIIREIDADITISMSYNTLEMSHITYNAIDAANLDLSPELIYEMSQTVAYLRDTRNPIENLLADSIAVSPTLDVDLTGTAPSNLIVGEIHTLNAQAGKVYIRPTAGSFYKTGLQVRVVATNTLLVLGTDYRVIRNNAAKTSESSEPGGVYDVIYVNTPIVGNVSVRYQAFGGEVSRKDVDAIFNTLVNVIEYISNAAFLTPNTIGGTTVFLQMVERLRNLEDTVRIMSTGGSPTYTDSTDGKAFLHKFASPDGTNQHWYTIAKLYMVAGSTTVYTKSQCRLKFQCANAGLMFEALFSVDINNPVKPIEVKIVGSSDSPKYTPYLDYLNIMNRIQPEFRIIWNDEIDIRSGVILQMGFNLKNIAIETVGIADVSGKESCWIAVTPPTTAVAPADDMIQLPNPVSLWSVGSVASKSAIATYTPDRGYLAWAGSIDLNTCSVTPISLGVGLVSPVDFQLKNISKVSFHIWDRVNGKMIVSDVQVVPTTSFVKTDTFFYPNDLCSVSFALNQVGQAYTMTLSSILGNASKDVHAFEIREITFSF